MARYGGTANETAYGSMRDPHQVIEHYGLEGARKRASSKLERQYIDAAAMMSANEHVVRPPIFGNRMIASLPHRRPSDQSDVATYWERELHSIRYRVESDAGPTAVPFGSKARMILLWLQHQAIVNQSRTLGAPRTMHAWAKRLGIESGGMTYKIAREQFDRIMRCRIAVTRSDDFANAESFLILERSTLSSAADDDTALLLSHAFFDHVTQDPIQLDPLAVALLSNNCWALDLYIILAGDLPNLTDVLFMSWRQFNELFGGHNKYAHHMKASFLSALPLVQAVYKQARVRVDPRGITYFRSPPPMLADGTTTSAPLPASQVGQA